MKKYKPEYLGKVIPADDPDQLTDFVQNKFEPFSKIYDAVKDQSEKINDIVAIDGKEKETKLAVKISTESETIQKISEKIKDDTTMEIRGDVITATV